MTERQRELKRARDARYNQSEKGRERSRRFDALRRSDPDFRRRKTIYMMWYRARRKKERYVSSGLTLSDRPDLEAS